ncbi:unnamed protein product [Dibothriocephalus latus]|uniref:Uncharacterized protein n=1 Tax=Dibothriocephalus latus TaxID=60516 RepID=A0A3P7LFB7_DIBLA|nr:unnamed protein product [Dibothriocephalus latus]
MFLDLGELKIHLCELGPNIISPNETCETGYDYAVDDAEVATVVERVHFTETVALKELLGLKESQSLGSDEIPAMNLKEFSEELTKLLSTLFQTSFETEGLPADWKPAWITPLYKGRNRISANNYDRSTCEDSTDHESAL